ncbi:hypothetical protein ABV488_002580 [Salmonella enterica]
MNEQDINRMIQGLTRSRNAFTRRRQPQQEQSTNERERDIRAAMRNQPER